MWKFRTKDVPTKDELYVRDIILEYLKNPKIVKEVTPTTGIYYLSNFDDNIYIMLTSTSVRITNHSFFYNKNFNMGFLDRMKRLVDQQIEREKEDFRKLIFSNEIDLLRSIYKKVKNG